MKKCLLLSIAAIVLASFANAQITKGSLFIGGQISGYTNKNGTGSSSQTQSSFYVSPSVGTAIRQNLVLGVDLLYGHSKNENGLNPDTKGNAFGGGVFLRKYVPIVNKFYFFLQGRAGYSHEKSKGGSGSFTFSSESNNFNLGLYPGVSYALTKALHIEAGFNNLALLSYSHATSKQTGFPTQNSSSNLSFSTGVSGTNLSFALRFIIPKK